MHAFQLISNAETWQNVSQRGWREAEAVEASILIKLDLLVGIYMHVSLHIYMQFSKFPYKYART